MEDEDSETTSLKYRTVNNRAGGRLPAKYDTQQTGDAKPANLAKANGETTAGQWRVTAMNQRKTTLVADTGDRVQHRDWVSNIGESRRQVNPPGPGSEIHNPLSNKPVEQFRIP